MIAVHFLDSDLHAFGADERRVVTDVCAEAESPLRAALPGLQAHVNLLVEAGSSVIDETGEVGFTMGPHLIKWTADPHRGVVKVASDHLRHALFHEAHHATRLVHFPAEAYATDWPSTSVEGLATVFERESCGYEPPWGGYDDEVIDAWASELFAQPISDTFAQWKFSHPDGRKWIAYRVGTWIADRAIANSGRSSADLATAPIAEVLSLAQVAL